MTKEFDNTDKAIDAMDAAMESALYAAAVKIHGDAVMMAPVDTGNLRGSISFSVCGGQTEGVAHPASPEDGVGSAPPDTAVVGTNVHYAPHMEFGTAPHEIAVRNAKVLTDGKKFFGKRVRHPGTAAQPFLEPALRDNYNEIQQLMKAQFAKRLKELTR